MTRAIREAVADQLRVKTADIDADAITAAKIADDAVLAANVKNIKTGTISANTPNLEGGISAETDATISGVVTTDNFILQSQGLTEGSVIIAVSGRCTTDGTLRVMFANVGTALAAVQEDSQIVLWMRIVA